MNCYDLIIRAMRRNGVLASGEQPTEDELNDALEALISIYTRFVAEGAFGALVDVIAGDGAFAATENTRVFRNSANTTSIELPETVIDAETGAERVPFDGSVIAVTDQFSPLDCVTYIYDGDVNQWIGVETLDATSPAPLAARDPGGLASLLAVELADEFGQQTPDATRFAAARYQSHLIMGFSRKRPSDPTPEIYF